MHAWFSLVMIKRLALLFTEVAEAQNLAQLAGALVHKTVAFTAHAACKDAFKLHEL